MKKINIIYLVFLACVHWICHSCTSHEVELSNETEDATMDPHGKNFSNSELINFIDSVNLIGLEHNSFLTAMLAQAEEDMNNSRDTFDFLGAVPYWNPLIDSSLSSEWVDSLSVYFGDQIQLSVDATDIYTYVDSELESWIVNSTIDSKCDSLILVIDGQLHGQERFALGSFCAIIKHSSHFWLDDPFVGTLNWSWDYGSPGSITWKQKEVLKADGHGAIGGFVTSIGSGPFVILATSFGAAWNSLIRAWELSCNVDLWWLP